MTKIKILTYTVIALAVLNLGMIVFFVGIKTKFFALYHKAPTKMIIERLQLDTKQQAVFEAMVALQIKRVKKNEKQIIATKENLYRI